MKFSAIEAAGKAVLEGKWVGDIATLPGVSFKMLGSAHPSARKFASEAIRALPEAQRQDPAAMEKIQREQAIEVLVQDWKGFQDDAGNEMAFSKEALRAALSNEAIAVILFDAINAAGDKVGRVEAEAVKADVKN